MEMSGLDPEKCKILEVAAIITDGEYEPLDQYHSVVFQPPEVMASMDEWCTTNHAKSGLSAAVKNGKREEIVEEELLHFISKYFKQEDRPILCGNSIGQDRKFIDLYMKKLSQRLHYRMLDVSSFKIVFKDKYKIEYTKKGSHRAIDDILESIAELKHYLSFVSNGASGQ